MQLFSPDLSPEALRVLDKLQAGADLYPNRLMGAFVAAVKLADEYPDNRSIVRWLNAERGTKYKLDVLSDWLHNRKPVPVEIQNFARREILELVLEDEELGRLIDLLGL